MNKFFFALILSAAANLASAQDTLRLSFQDAVTLGLENNILLRQEKNNLRVTEVDRTQSKTLYLPNISANSQIMQINGQQFDIISGSLDYVGSQRFGATVEAYYTIFDGLGRVNTVKKSTQSLLSQASQVERTEQQIIFTVANQYLQALLDKELLRIAEKNLEVQKTTLRQIDGFVTAGTHPLSNKLDQEAEVKRIEVNVIRAENKLRIDKAMLSQTLLLESGLEIDPQEPGWSFESILGQDYDVNEIYKEALQNRPDYKKALADQEAAQASLNISRALHYPTLNAFFQYGSNYSSLAKSPDPETGDLEEIPFQDQFFDFNPTSAVGLQLDIPIFNQYRTISQKTRSKVSYENSKLSEENLKLTIYREVQNAYLDLVASKNSYFASQSQFQAAQEAYKIQNERYSLGVGNLVELSQSTRVFVEAAASRAQAQYTLLFQKIMLDYYIGTLSAEGVQ